MSHPTTLDELAAYLALHPRLACYRRGYMHRWRGYRFLSREGTRFRFEVDGEYAVDLDARPETLSFRGDGFEKRLVSAVWTFIYLDDEPSTGGDV